jgi:hypothetical protein
MTRIEIVHMAACMTLHASDNETEARNNAKNARRAAELLADELGLVAEVNVEVPNLVQAALDGANERIAALEAEIEQLRDAVHPRDRPAPPPLVGPKARR